MVHKRRFLDYLLLPAAAKDIDIEEGSFQPFEPVAAVEVRTAECMLHLHYLRSL
jgi:hypothetical protein